MVAGRSALQGESRGGGYIPARREAIFLRPAGIIAVVSADGHAKKRGPLAGPFVQEVEDSGRRLIPKGGDTTAAHEGQSTGNAARRQVNCL
jgi:hypothetical protein